jgi:signal transduction histidine kinase
MIRSKPIPRQSESRDSNHPRLRWLTGWRLISGVRNRTLSIRLRFAMWTAGLLFLTLTLFSGYVYFSMSAGLYHSLDDSMAFIASQATSDIAIRHGKIQVGEDFSDFTRSLIANGSARRDLTIQLFDPQGHSIESLGPFASLPIAPEPIAVESFGGVFAATIADPVTHEPLREAVLAVPVAAGQAGTVRVIQSLDEIQATLSQLRLLLLVGNPLLILFAGAGGYFLAGRALQPIDRIVQTAHQISAEDLSARLTSPSSQDEVGRLTDTLNEMLARLEESFQRERRFIVDASHELRTPVTAIQTVLSTTLAKERSKGEYEQALRDLSLVSGRLLKLTQGLLSLAHRDPDLGTRARPVDLTRLLEDVTDSLRPVAAAKVIDIICSAQPGLRLLGDEDGLIRLFYNLIENAIKYTPAGDVSIQANHSADQKSISVTIADSGVGISPEDLPHVFERFYRADPSRATAGVGLGLAIAHEVARAHHGGIQVDSRVGVGSVFSVSLPTGE